jgi:mono/diheme cytochrome c family protein
MKAPGSQRRTQWLIRAGRVFAIALIMNLAAVAALAGRLTSGLQAQYDFSGTGALVKDGSGVGEPLNLVIASAGAVRRSPGGLEIRSGTVIRSEKPASKIIDAVRASGETTIEAWIRPAKADQSGPARIVTLSKDPNERNFTLAQDGDRFDARFRTTQTSANGIPSLASPAKSLSAELTHVVYTRNSAGQARIFVNGKRVVEKAVAGSLSNWDSSFRLALGNELTSDRPWLGTFRLVAIYSRRLSTAEVEQNFKAGPGQTAAPEAPAVAQKKSEPREAAAASKGPQFVSQIAPLLSKHCVECHGPEKKKGRLDLSQKDLALAGGKGGKAIVPGNSSESLLWKKVESDEMPDEGPPLSAEEKKLLREWINSGAAWPAQATVPIAKAARRETGRNWVRRLTVPEYIETVRSAVDVNIAKEARELLPPEVRADGFNNTAYNLNIDLAHVEAYARLAEIIAGRVDPAFAGKYAKCQALSEACMRELIGSMGKWILRGPLDERESSVFLDLAMATEKAGGDYKQAATTIIEAMLQSPRLIYRMEKERAKPEPVGQYELASRLSYMAWGGPPDLELMRAAEKSELATAAQVQAQVQRMLKDPRAIERSLRFAEEWLNLEALANMRPNKKRFPKWHAQLAADMRNETRAFFREVVWEQKRPLWDLMNAELTYATPRLAAHYRFPSSLNPDLSFLKNRGSASEGLLALYTFEEGSGDIVRDVSGTGEALNLRIEDTSAAQWGKDRLVIKEPTLIASVESAKKVTEAIRKSKAITLEAWITPAATNQTGPARILTLSADTGQRNFTLGQDGGKFDVRLRTTQADANGQPSLPSATTSAQGRLTHVAYTRLPSGRANIYVNGEQKGGHDIGGDTSNWDDRFRLALGNELTKDRPWRGTLHRVAIYSRALAPEEILSRAQALSRYDLASVPGRGGLLTQGSILTAGGDDASMVTRGLFVLHDFLWDEVQDPPPCVDTTPVPTKPGLTQRAIAESRLGNASCAGCHSKFEPLAFGLEKFNGLGAYQEKDEHGNALREDGNILFPDSKSAVAYKSSAELMNLLAGSERVRQGMTRKITQFAIGRPLTSTDGPIVEKIHNAAQSGGGTYASIITAIATSDLVRMAQPDTK